MAKLFTNSKLETLATQEWVKNHFPGGTTENPSTTDPPDGNSVILVPNDHFFPNESARDAFFTSEIREGTNCIIESTPPVLQQFRDGQWTDITPIIQVPKGAKGKDGVGVPPGGTTNQALVKKSDADYDTEWESLPTNTGGGYAPPAGGIPKSDLAAGVQDSLDKADTAVQPEDLEHYISENHSECTFDTSGLATKTELAEAVAGIELPDISLLASKEDVEALAAAAEEIPDIGNLATKTELAEAVAGIELPDISHLASMEDVAAAVSNAASDYAPAGHTHDGYASAEQGAKADTAVQPEDISGLATKEDVEALAAAAEEIPGIDHLATKTELAEAVAGIELPDISLLASKEDVIIAVNNAASDYANAGHTHDDYASAEQGAKADTAVQPEDISGLATKEDVEALAAAAEEIPGIDHLATKTELAEAVAGIELPDISLLASKEDVIIAVNNAASGYANAEHTHDGYASAEQGAKADYTFKKTFDLPDIPLLDDDYILQVKGGIAEWVPLPTLAGEEMPGEQQELFSFTINTKAAATFSIPTSHVFPYDWMIDWGDVSYQKVSGVGDINSTGIQHTYAKAGVYVITIKPRIFEPGWFRAFGFRSGTSGANSITNKGKLIAINSSFTMAMFCDPNTLEAGDNVACLMFYGCDGLTLLPKQFNFPQKFIKVGNNFASRMFYNCKSLTSLPVNFNLPQSIDTVGNGFAQQMFYGCSKLVINNIFRFPQELAAAQVNKSNVFANTFQNVSAVQSRKAAEIIGTLPVPSANKTTFRGSGFPDLDLIHSSWK